MRKSTTSREAIYHLESRKYNFEGSRSGMVEGTNDVKKVGKLLFGRSLRLQLALWIVHRDELTFYQSEPAAAVGVSTSNVIEELDRLARLGMIQAVAKLAGERRQYYLRTDSPLWQVIESAGRVAANVAVKG